MHVTLKVAAVSLLLATTARVQGQSTSAAKPDFAMRVCAGEQVPEMVFGKIKNQNDKPVRFSDFRGKLLILDFWTTNCAPCIAAMPKMEALQQAFAEQVQVILVTRNTSAAVAALTERSRILQRNALPMITDDTLLEKLFPYTGTPTHAWVGNDGKLLFVTGGYNTTKETVQQYLNGTTLAIKNEELQPGAEEDIASLVTGSGNENLRCYSIFTGRSTTTTQSIIGLRYDSANQVIGYKAENTDLHGLLTTRFLNEERITKGLYLPNRVIWKVKNIFPYKYPDDKTLESEWREHYLYCYELRLPRVVTERDVNSYVASDLKRYFGVSAKLANRKMECWVLVRTSKNDKIRTKGGKHVFHPQEDYSGFEGIAIRPVDFMIQAIGEVNFKSPFPVVDGTGYKGRVDLTINANLRDLPAVRKALRQYDLDIVVRQETIPMIVISEER